MMDNVSESDVTHRNRSLLQAFAQFLSVEVRRLALLADALDEVHNALDRLGKEIIVCVAMLLCFWHLLSDFLARLLALLSR